ncbi:DUF1214 domain-containing protein [Phenylobacterium sp. LjRoot225]|uniref:hypothetical protein n=1 Tax=Phenylobacterium sp. LjRoot225 TaxID=3342285 RepID=UPI003ECD0393
MSFLLGALLFAVAVPPAGAAEPPPAGAIAGWNDFVDQLRTLPDRLLAKLPESLRQDPQVQQEVARLVLESLAVSSLDAIGGDGDHPMFLANQNLTLDLPMPNADTTYRVSRITPGGTYRLRGERGSLRMAHLSQVGPGRSALDLNTLQADAQGRFDLLLSPTRPAGYDGDWWPLQPSTNRLLLRLVNSDWGRERDPTIAIERLDRPPQRPRPSAADLEQRLRSLPQAAAVLPMMFVDHVAKLREEGYVNRLKLLDLSQIGGVAGQSYFEGAYDLASDDALLIETQVPAGCTYYSFILGNEIHETTDWHNNHSSLNDSQAKRDEDGVLRIVVSARDPGVPNWLDTAGYPRGLVQARWTGCPAPPPLVVRKASLVEVRRLLPRETPVVTPAERDAVIRARRLALQQRPLW